MSESNELFGLNGCPSSIIEKRIEQEPYRFLIVADNPQSLTAPLSLCTDGDTAPNRRFKYRFIWSKEQFTQL